MKKTKIICTMGPNTNNRETMLQLAQNGMDIARFNFSHGDHEEQLGRISILKSVREELGIPVAMLLDTKGPEIRTGVLKDDKKVTLKEGETYILTIEDIVGDEKTGHINYSGIVNDVVPGNRILIDDGLIELEVTEVSDKNVVCTIINGGELGGKKGVNVPNVSINLPALTQKDKDDIIFGIEQGMDFIAASFVRSADAIKEIRKILKEHNSTMAIIAKIENAEGIENIDEIIRCSDGIMVARGDLGVEIPVEQLPKVQKMIIKKCNENYTPVITATQMLDSMIRNPRPTRAEVTDVANAIYDGTDAIMLSGETAMGKYPVEALRMMVHIAETTEPSLDYDALMNEKKNYNDMEISGAVGYSSVATAMQLNAKYIFAASISGLTPRLISKIKPKTDIIGVSPNDSVVRRMQLYWGVTPLKSVGVDSKGGTAENIVDESVDIIKKQKFVEAGDIIVLTSGVPADDITDCRAGITNNMKVIVIE